MTITTVSFTTTSKENLLEDLPAGPVVKNLASIWRTQVLSLVRELRSHML